MNDQDWKRLESLISASHTSRVDSINELRQDFQDFKDSMKPIVDAYNKGNVSFWFIKWIVSGIVIVLSLVLAVKQLR